jgi:hypothetical protein
MGTGIKTLLQRRAGRTGFWQDKAYATRKTEVFTAVPMKNVAFWDINTQFVPHRKHITSPLESPTG